MTTTPDTTPDYVRTTQPSLPQLLTIAELLSKRGLSNAEAHALLNDAIENGRTPWGNLAGLRMHRHGQLIALLRRQERKQSTRRGPR
ncbi:hypothetical protein [Deinococcus fonticola]|uniref:hypothetical protein n=1 Tax=Deinococcus fonticola TaxID=2528713 RepID=UPI001074AA6C|nr:hypothetical protein [Deinococcus fonticola]